MNVSRVWGLGAGAVAVAFAVSQSLACSSSSSGPGDNDGGGSSSGGSSSGMAQEGGGGSSSSSSSGGGSCDAGVFSFDMASANSCIASYAPSKPSTFTAGHCPAGTDGCCFKQGPCGFTSNCSYNIGALASQQMTQCTNGGGTWQTTPP